MFNRVEGEIRAIVNQSVYNEARWGEKPGKVQSKNRPTMAHGAVQKMLISNGECAELFRKLETGVSERIRRQDLSGSFAVEGRSRGIKDMFRNEGSGLRVAGAFIPDHRDITVRFPHSLSRRASRITLN